MLCPFIFPASMSSRQGFAETADLLSDHPLGGSWDHFSLFFAIFSYFWAHLDPSCICSFFFRNFCDLWSILGGLKQVLGLPEAPRGLPGAPPACFFDVFAMFFSYVNVTSTTNVDP